MPSLLLQQLIEHQMVAIARGIGADRIEPVANALADGGIRLLEVTLNTDGALEMISLLRANTGDRLHIGAGTVLDLGQAKEAIAAGAQYLISPHLDESIVAYGVEQGVDVWPGAMTPTEIVRAYQAGASAVKLFPFASLGIGYLKEIRAPLDQIPIIATGGVNPQNIRSVLDAGAVAVGLGNGLLDRGMIRSGDYEALTKHARSFVAAAKATNGTH
ncbi:bifunctional 4-hydroxy-2-oxoglutarate aldolase/2-dehydro-3-deoxy-phosphogluconate aldolase [Cohnella faecalis]|uniref:Bifunctional 4-hydroxy-2-oxoglutarate aldolase/2-dehydro-3-deoxy-phosphogluconate aldolase n=1 Tax=Cohnella faecalis TaxID=2315694 RepID=A0A398CLR6_9BACL|nr:bifunctional 4-hydroxy-2-oxoglutarate aldolase/2-dehydro-3-deoxy-phosphogluconate aldolase [Cohnella faecalis]RIE00787.1 bifunctional 4-hydroxy-2-oxoglutarate aldolase/2-dehydro-3-deoxy-phosphogluconate aldolase [Cohnella faecalis]